MTGVPDPQRELRHAVRLAQRYLEYLEPPYGGPPEIERVPPADMLRVARALVLATSAIRLAA
ncbi:MAG: hypothetical protein HYX52_05840 [Chloroflexi bacterium]|nr:hypothetical protein [Chloroflexota bacterium]